MDRAAALAFAVLLLGAAAAPTDPATLAGRTGRPVRDFIFAPMKQPAATLSTSGKPMVIVVFASWCAACIAEMPTLLTDARAFGDQANFVGIDYEESITSARAFIMKTRIPFATESFDEESNLSGASASPLVVHVPGGRLTPDALEAFKDAVSAQTYNALVQIAQAQQSNRGDVAALEQRLGVRVTDVSSFPDVGSKALPLPHAFVIDGSGVLREELTGYDAERDELQAALHRLGLREHANP